MVWGKQTNFFIFLIAKGSANETASDLFIWREALKLHTSPLIETGLAKLLFGMYTRGALIILQVTFTSS